MPDSEVAWPRCMTRAVYIFFFQAEDGIRDYKATGVQTCALPILAVRVPRKRPEVDGRQRPDEGGTDELDREERPIRGFARSVHDSVRVARGEQDPVVRFQIHPSLDDRSDIDVDGTERPGGEDGFAGPRRRRARGREAVPCDPVRAPRVRDLNQVLV